MMKVQLLAFPIPLWKESTAHHEAIQRELDIIRTSLPEDSLPNRLREFLDDVGIRFAQAGAPMLEAMVAAAERGEEATDIEAMLPPEAGAAARAMREILAEMDEFCRAGDTLLTLVTPEPLVAFREWFLRELERQLDEGLPPLDWVTYSGALPAAPAEPTREPDQIGREHIIEFVGELDLSTANELLGRIQAARANGTPALVIDLTGVTFVDSVGLSLLISANNRVVEDGGRLRLLLPERMRSLFEITGLLEHLDIEFAA
jgi:anti-anti-sigma factor